MLEYLDHSLYTTQINPVISLSLPPSLCINSIFLGNPDLMQGRLLGVKCKHTITAHGEWRQTGSPPPHRCTRSPVSWMTAHGEWRQAGTAPPTAAHAHLCHG